MNREMLDEAEEELPANAFLVFFYLLRKANYAKGKTIERGELLTSYQHIADATKITYKQARNAIDALVSLNYVAKRRAGKWAGEWAGKGQCLTVCKYDSYTTEWAGKGQADGQTNGQHHNKVLKKEEEYKEKYSVGTEYKKKAAFEPPSLTETVEYFIAQQSNQETANHFHDHFQSNGWLVGGKTKMKDWRAAARNWIRNEHKYKKTNGTTRNIRTESNSPTTGRAYNFTAEQLHNLTMGRSAGMQSEQPGTVEQDSGSIFSENPTSGGSRSRQPLSLVS